jgi:hypothetical protein
MRKTHRDPVYDEWLAEEIRTSIGDARPGVPHDEVMAEMAAEIASLKAARREAGKGGPAKRSGFKGR